jgi:hypothetical protein
MMVTVISRHYPTRVFQCHLLCPLDTGNIFCMRFGVGFAGLEFFDSIAKNTLHGFIQKLDCTVCIDDTYDIGNLFDNAAKSVCSLHQLLFGSSCLGDIAAYPPVTQKVPVSAHNRLTLGAQNTNLSVGMLQRPDHAVLFAFAQRATNPQPLVRIIDTPGKCLFTSLANDIRNRDSGNFFESTGLVGKTELCIHFPEPVGSHHRDIAETPQYPFAVHGRSKRRA